MVVNDSPGEECRVAILQDNHLEELYTERTATATNVGNIYKGRVTNVEPAIQAAFVDYGEGQSGFLHISDLHPKYFPGQGATERVGMKIPRRQRPPIQDALRRGREILVQVMKEGIGTKGPTLTSYISIPGRLVVMMPDMDRIGVSRKVEDEQRRRQMRQVLDSIELPEGFGFILRTAGFGANKTDLKRDVAYLTRLWKAMDSRLAKSGAPCPLYTESDLLIRTIRDVLRPSIKAIIVDSESAFERASAFLRVVAPRSAPKVLHYRRQAPIFHAFDIERQIDLIHSREVPLPSGGAIVIDQTEALVAIDVNSGKSRSANDAETNAYRTNCEAVDEIARQLRLRDLGGLVVNDLIDMRSSKNRRLIEERFRNNLKSDRARSTILKISDFGIVEMTRQRMRPGIGKANFVPCAHCHGRGEVKAPEYLGSFAARHTGYLLQYPQVARVEIVCSPHVASFLLSHRRRQLVELEDITGKSVDVRVSDAIAADRVDFYAYDARNADIAIEKLPAVPIPTLTKLEQDQPPETARPAGKPAEGEAAEAEPVEAEAGAEAEERPGRRRRRRRRGGETPRPVETGIAAVVDEAESATAADEAAEPETGGRRRKKRRSRRRRGRGGDAERTEAAEVAEVVEVAEAAEAAETVEAAEATGAAETAEAAAEPESPEPGVAAEAPARTGRRRRRKEPRSKGIRVHVLAKQLSTTSKALIERCGELGIEVKNHMSSLEPDDESRLRLESGRTAGPGAVEETAPERGEVEAAPAAVGADGEEARPRRRRRSRRRGRRSEDPAPSGTEAEPTEPVEATPEPAADSTPPEPAAEEGPRRSRRRRRRGGAGKADDLSEGKDDTPPVDVPAEAELAKVPVVTTTAGSGADEPVAEGAAAAPAKRPRRLLYRRRSSISSARPGPRDDG
jgi:ribonuclease E